MREQDFPWWLRLLTTHIGNQEISALPGNKEYFAVLGHPAERIAKGEIFIVGSPTNNKTCLMHTLSLS